MSVADVLVSHLDEFGLVLPPELPEKLEQYAFLLREWNEKINLTSITDDEGIAVKHFLDSLMLLRCPAFQKTGTLIDVGTGAGLPGLVLAMAVPTLSVTLLDATGKKVTAVRDMVKKLGVTNCRFAQFRAEEAGRMPEYREKYDFATARAVAKLNVLCEYCLPFVKPGGTFFACKAASAKEELSEAENALSVLNGECVKINTFKLCSEGERNIISIRKISQLSPKYPRPFAKISKAPL